MPNANTYEIHIRRDGEWMLIAVHSEEEKSRQQAESMYGKKPEIMGIKVIGHYIDEKAGEVYPKTLLEMSRDAAPPNPDTADEAAGPDQPAEGPPASGSQKPLSRKALAYGGAAAMAAVLMALFVAS
ncbi:MAG: hypothetical protein ISR52_02660 [Rhodospirillales bacterium]|nr:hypothetical protein [Rhodospirillales bacterium]